MMTTDDAHTGKATLSYNEFVVLYPGYGLAFIIVLGTYVAFEEPYERTAQLCFLSRDNMAILGFIAPLTVSTGRLSTARGPPSLASQIKSRDRI